MIDSLNEYHDGYNVLNVAHGVKPASVNSEYGARKGSQGSETAQSNQYSAELSSKISADGNKLAYAGFKSIHMSRKSDLGDGSNTQKSLRK